MVVERTWLVANWKMHGTRARAGEYARQFGEALAATPAVQGVFCPPSLYIDAAKAALPGTSPLALGAQDCHKQGDGAFTGEISARMLADVGAGYVILGHSERRQHCNETCLDVVEKAQAALAAGLTPILCVGEREAEYEAGQTQAVLGRQLEALRGLEVGRYLIAYEPVWAIGTGRTPRVDEIAAAHAQVKSTLGSTVSVLYGGSVKPNNIREILAQPQVNGALIGGASLEIESMLAMLVLAAQHEGL